MSGSRKIPTSSQCIRITLQLAKILRFSFQLYELLYELIGMHIGAGGKEKKKGLGALSDGWQNNSLSEGGLGSVTTPALAYILHLLK